ncbi:hypothetical protein OG851_42975 (plasmid) [Streptomyces sp. NBC_00161]|uniref:hypothetical protein n=1 Tax=Streptomyces sp. NBC_00161 TaxID=2975671 RepID=UPI002F913F05
MAVRVQMSPEVETALGPEMSAKAREFSEGTCAGCGEPLDGPTNVLLGQSSTATAGAIWWTHAGCSDSRIIELDETATAALVEPEGGAEMLMYPAMAHGEPVLLAELAGAHFTQAGPQAEIRSILMQVLLQQGFQLMTDPGAQPTQLDGWAAVLLPHGTAMGLLILQPDGARFFEGSITKPPGGWTKAVAARRSCLLLGGDLGINREGDDRRVREALLDAARTGKLAGARITCGTAADYGLE